MELSGHNLPGASGSRPGQSLSFMPLLFVRALTERSPEMGAQIRPNLSLFYQAKELKSLTYSPVFIIISTFEIWPKKSTELKGG